MDDCEECGSPITTDICECCGPDCYEYNHRGH